MSEEREYLVKITSRETIDPDRLEEWVAANTFEDQTVEVFDRKTDRRHEWKRGEHPTDTEGIED